MDSIKNSLKKELQAITFTEQRKREIVHNVKKAHPKNEHAFVWKYRMVLTSFVLLSMTIVFINRKAPNFTQAEGGETRTIMDFLAYDSVKTLILAVLFFVIYRLIKRSIRSQERTLPSCASCGTVWTRKLALQKAFSNEKTSCWQCGKENYQSRKSRKKTSLFQLPIFFMIIAGNVFEHGVLGVIVYFAYLAILTIRLTPYYVELQLDDPIKERWW